MRPLLGFLLILHGLAHAGAGMWSAGPEWLITFIWWLATALYITAGMGVLGFRKYANYTVELSFAAIIPSALLLSAFAGWFVLPGVVLDFVLLLAVIWLRDRLERVGPPLRYRGRLAQVAVVTLLTYVSAAILLRPWAMRMGSTEAERSSVMFGDSLYPGARYRIDNAITIHAPAESVWPWIAQIGQDRGGFYSYDRLERLFGVRVRNVDSIVPEWQEREVGELVRCCQPGFLGGILGDEPGWRIEAIDPGRALVLENWGAFIVHPIDSATSRFHIRQRNPGKPSFVGNLLAPVGLLVLEPAHFIMQRGMLRGIKARAERTA